MRIISMTNQKGGVAKTTSTYNLAALKAIEGCRVLMVDLDPQASLTISCGYEPDCEYFEGFSTCDLFNSKKSPVDCCFKVDKVSDNLYLIPSTIYLAKTEMSLITMSNREYKLKKALNTLEEYFDYVFIDCPPQLGMLTINGLAAADDVIIPVESEYLPYRGLDLLVETIQEEIIDEGINPDINILGALVTIFKKNEVIDNEVLMLIQNKMKVIGIIPKRADNNKGIAKGLPVAVQLPNTDIAEAYKQVCSVI